MSSANPTVRRVETVERMTHAEFMEVAPEDRKAELIEGVMHVPRPALEAHERLFGFLFTILNLFVARGSLGRVLGSRYTVYISDTETYEPDILFAAAARMHLITEKNLAGAPNLVVEILSANTARYDRGVKRRNYEQAGVESGSLRLPPRTDCFTRLLCPASPCRWPGFGRTRLANYPILSMFSKHLASSS